MKYILKIIFVLTFLHGNSQFNLVPNPSFETYTNCPSSSNQVPFASPWMNPTSGGSPDYYNACSSLVGVPYCGGPCFQYAKTGSAYTGLYSYGKQVSNVREYIQAQLTSALITGKCYYVGFYTNEANWTGMACNKLGAYLSPNQISLSGPSYLMSYPSQIKTFNNVIIRDTLNWHLISGVFQSVSNEQYLTIGNFNSDATTDTLTFNTSAPSPSAYYYIDDVFVIPVDSIPGGMPAFAGNNITINSGDSTFIGQTISNLNCSWFIATTQIATNTAGLWVKPTSTTTYIVQQTLCGITTTDTVTVTVIPLGINSSAFLNNLQIVPNPGSGHFIISGANALREFEIEIKDVTGKYIYREEIIFTKGQTSLDLDLNNGIYFISILNKESGQRAIKKIVIQK
jgi:hypothetical protein